MFVSGALTSMLTLALTLTLTLSFSLCHTHTHAHALTPPSPGAAPIAERIGVCPVPLDVFLDAMMAPPSAPFIR